MESVIIADFGTVLGRRASGWLCGARGPGWSWSLGRLLWLTIPTHGFIVVTSLLQPGGSHADRIAGSESTVFQGCEGG